MRTPYFRVSIRYIFLVIAVIGLAMFAVRQMFFANTVYSVGYDESRFWQVRVGMTPADVEALVGPPLERGPWWADRDLERWMYTWKRHSGYYWKREVFMKDGKVFNVVNMYFNED